LVVRTKDASPLRVGGGCAQVSLHLEDRTA
jgi:hypothetical protein